MKELIDIINDLNYHYYTLDDPRFPIKNMMNYMMN